MAEQFTPKQVRNGADQGGGEHNTALADEGPMPAIPMGAATAAGNLWNEQGHSLWDTPAGSGAQDVGPPGPMFEWDAGLAINDVEGGGSS